MYVCTVIKPQIINELSVRTVLLTIISSLLFAQTIDAKTINVLEYGAVGNGINDDAIALQKAIDECSQTGGGQVILPAGRTYLSSPLELKSNVDLHIEANATLLANPDWDKYTLSAFGENKGEGTMWLYANGAQNISITGTGTIDGNAYRFMGKELFDSYELQPNETLQDGRKRGEWVRPHVMTLVGVKNLTIRDVTVRGAAYWTIHLAGCDNVVISGIDLLNDIKIRNCDGIDIDHSKNVRISDCHIVSGDDCVCLKNRREYSAYGSCHDIVVTNCVMTSRSCAIKIGSENVDSIYNVAFNNCIITASNRGLGIQNRDEGTVTNVTFSNIQLECLLWSDIWWGKAEPIYVTAYPRKDSNDKDGNWRFPKGQTRGTCGEVSQIYFNDIIATAESGCFVGGDKTGKVNNVYFNNVRLNITNPQKRIKDRTYKSGVYDRRPCRGQEFIDKGLYGLYVEQATGVHSEGLHINTTHPLYVADRNDEQE